MNSVHVFVLFFIAVSLFGASACQTKAPDLLVVGSSLPLYPQSEEREGSIFSVTLDVFGGVDTTADRSFSPPDDVTTSALGAFYDDRLTTAGWNKEDAKGSLDGEAADSCSEVWASCLVFTKDGVRLVIYVNYFSRFNSTFSQTEEPSTAPEIDYVTLHLEQD